MTANRGANVERSAILAHVRRVRRQLFAAGAAESVLDQWDALIAWLGQRNERYARRPGLLKGRR